MKQILLATALVLTVACGGAQAGQASVWTSADEQQLFGLFDKLMKLERTPNHTWKGIQQGFLPLPEKRCKEERHKVAGGTAVRVVCN